MIEKGSLWRPAIINRRGSIEAEAGTIASDHQPPGQGDGLAVGPDFLDNLNECELGVGHKAELCANGSKNRNSVRSLAKRDPKVIEFLERRSAGYLFKVTKRPHGHLQQLTVLSFSVWQMLKELLPYVLAAKRTPRPQQVGRR